MSKIDKKNPLSPLVEAALAFDEELTRFAHAADAVCRRPLDSQKNLAAVSQALSEATDSEIALPAKAQALLQALVAARDVQTRQSEEVRARARELEARTVLHNELMTKLQGLGQEAGALSELARRLMGEKRAGELMSERAEVQAGLNELDVRVTDAASGAETLMTGARESEFEEIARQAHSFQQMFLGIRNKVGILRRALVPDSPAA